MRDVRKFATLDAGRGIAALAVTLHHAAQTAAITDRVQDGAKQQPFEGFAIGVSYFFVLSGAVIFLAHRADLGRPSTALRYVKKRLLRIYPIYCIAVALFWVVGQRMRPLPMRFLFDMVTLVRTSHDSYRVFSVSWTLFHEIFFYAMFLLVLLHRRFGMIALALWWAIAAFTWRPGELSFGDTISSVQLLFAFGLFAGWFLSSGRRVRIPGTFITCGSALLVGSMLYANHLGYFSQTAYLMGGLGALLLILGLAEFERTDALRVPRVLQFLGEASYSLYLVHLSALAFVSTVMLHFRRVITFNFSVRLVIMFAIATAFGCCFRLWVEVPLMRRIQRSR